MTPHRLDPLLRPRSIAVVGASTRAGAVGNEVLINLRRGGYAGALYPVNPGRDTVDRLPCFASLSALPEVPQLVVFAVNDTRLEACFDEAVALGVEAATVFSAMVLPGASTPGASTPGASSPGLAARIQKKARHAGMLLHGGNSMGFFNFGGDVWVSGFDTREHRRPGNVVLLSQSGAGMSGILDCEERLDFLFAASTGQELCLSVEDYLDYVLTRLTAVGALYLAAVCLLPEFLLAEFSLPYYFGGTSLLIVVVVTMDTVAQIQSHLLAHQYEGLIKKAKLRGRRG